MTQRTEVLFDVEPNVFVSSFLLAAGVSSLYPVPPAWLTAPTCIVYGMLSLFGCILDRIKHIQLLPSVDHHISRICIDGDELHFCQCT